MWEFFFLWWLYETELQEHLGCVNLCVCVCVRVRVRSLARVFVFMSFFVVKSCFYLNGYKVA